jgi:ATP-binding cassette subfamily C (CFTR/MRP) protein 4
MSNYWLVYWGTETYTAQQNSSLFLYIYIALTLGVVIIAHLRAYYWLYILWCGSADLHNRMLQGILYSSMRFFESNPIGRILNRATRDQQIIDEVLPMIFLDAVQTLIIALGAFFIICIIEPLLIFIIILLLTICLYLRRFYMRSNRQMRHLESITRSPIYAFFSSSLEGVATIRAFKIQENFIETFMKLMDTNARAYITMTASTHWFNFHIDLIVLLFQLATTIATLLISHEHKTPVLGLILTYSFTLSQSLVRGMQQLATAEIHTISAQRIDEYALLPPEEDNGGDQGLVETEKDWPGRGTIEFRNYTMRYRNELEPVLNQINLCINSMEKIGIIGRTGRKKFC